MKLVPDSWFTDIFKRAVFRVVLETPDFRVAEGDLDYLLDHARSQSHAFYYAKVPIEKIEAVRVLSSAGFYVVDVNVTFRHETPREYEAAVGCYTIRESGADDAEAVLEIAKTTFRYSRFHLDPMVSEELANRVKHDWMANYFSGRRGETIWVATEDERPVGFLAVVADSTSRRIDLIGVARGRERQGIGKALVSFFISHYGSQCSCLEVGTQIANIPSTRLYENLGFRIFESSLVLHKHVGSYDR